MEAPIIYPRLFFVLTFQSMDEVISISLQTYNLISFYDFSIKVLGANFSTLQSNEHDQEMKVIHLI
jgi:hypothetical protein